MRPEAGRPDRRSPWAEAGKPGAAGITSGPALELVAKVVYYLQVDMLMREGVVRLVREVAGAFRPFRL